MQENNLFREIKLRFETSANTPPPYSYQYELVLRPSFQFLSAELNLKYLDREDLDIEDIENEGFTANDDFAWKGRIEKIWRDELEKLLSQTKLTNKEVSENSDYVEIEILSEKLEIGMPTHYKEWLGLSQELLQAIFETSGKERPFEIQVLKIENSEAKQCSLVASFASKQISIDKGKNLKEMPWKELPYLMQTIFRPDYIQETASTKKPSANGLYVNIGDGLWYEVGKDIVEIGTKTEAIKKLNNLLNRFVG